jgi:hypothetical protein
MSQNESKSKGSSLLMPLAIGGGLLLLFMGIKKAKAQGEGSLPALPELDANQAAPQIVPEAAPKYTDVIDEGEDQDTTESSSPSSSPASNNYEEENEDTSNSGGYQFNNSIPKSIVKPILNSKKEIRFIGNGKPKLGIRAQSDQAKQVQQKARNNSPVKSPIPFIAQAQKAIAQSKAAPKIFPLKQGQTNNYIKEVQRKMGVSPTGFFGTQTRAALLKKYKATEVSEALYKQIISGKAPANKPIIPLKKTLPNIKKPIKVLRKK